MTETSFEDFARGFRERTTQRLMDFEKTLAKAQEDVEKAAQQARQQARQHAGSTPIPPPGTAQHRPQGYGYGNVPARGKAQGQVRSVLRRDG